MAIALCGTVSLELTGCSGDKLSAGGCTTTRDCAAGQVCLGGACSAVSRRVGCRNNDDCDQGEYCDIVEELCKLIAGSDGGGTGDVSQLDTGADAGLDDAATSTRADAGDNSCQRDRDCGPQPQNICVGNQCIAGCNEPGGLMCTGGTVCDVATGHCRNPDPTCVNDTDCMPGPPTQICDNMTCVFGCGIDPTLCNPQTEVCDTNTGRCVPGQMMCMNDAQCGPPQMVCEGTQCVNGCGQAGGIQCNGATPFCNTMTGRCEAPPPCQLDIDCMNPDQICVNMACVIRCDRPGGAACNSPNVCNAETGRCVPGGLALGVACSFDAQCDSDVCLGVTRNMMSEQFCSTPCGAAGDCPLQFSCLYLSGAQYCFGESFFNPPATFDTPAGGGCMTGSITCQSGWCNTGANMCLETCSRNSDCANFGNNCWTFTQSNMGTNDYAHLCVQQTGTAAGQTCAVNADCASGICNRYTNRCATQCCSENDCAASDVCAIYDLDTTQGLIVRTCATPQTPGAGRLGANCTLPEDCESGICAPTVPTSSTSPRRCSTFCCTENDCGALPSGGKCRGFNGPTINMNQTIVNVCVPN